jgi:hypothetical protein
MTPGIMTFVSTHVPHIMATAIPAIIGTVNYLCSNKEGPYSIDHKREPKATKPSMSERYIYSEFDRSEIFNFNKVNSIHFDQVKELYDMRLQTMTNTLDIAEIKTQNKKLAKKLKKQTEKLNSIDTSIDVNESLREPYMILCKTWNKYSDGATHIEGSYYRSKEGKIILRPKGFPSPNRETKKEYDHIKYDHINIMGERVKLSAYGFIHIQRHRDKLRFKHSSETSNSNKVIDIMSFDEPLKNVK